jgi:hypothetical protein
MKKPNRRQLMSRSVAGATLLGCTGSPAPAQAQGVFRLDVSDGRITSLKRAGDSFDTDYIAPGQGLGDVILTLRPEGANPLTLNTRNLNRAAGSSETTSLYDISDGMRSLLQLRISLQPVGSRLIWTLGLKNLSAQPLHIEDLALPLPMHTRFLQDQPATAAVLKHSFVSGHGSFLFWMRSNSAGPYLLMTPEANTHLEYWDKQALGKDQPKTYCAYIHSAAAGAASAQKGCNWRQPHTRLTLAAAGQAGDSHDYGFQFSWASDYDDVRRKLVEGGLIDVMVAPGMTVPSDLSTRIALRTRDPIHSITAEYPQQTQIEKPAMRQGRHIYEIRFTRLGENRLSLHHGKGRTTHLEFFVTEPIETLIKKRGAFIARHQHRDTAKWYNGLLAEWNMETQTLLGPDNYDRIKGWRIYEVTCDDPGLSKPAYLASKNALYPVQAEVEALDYYVTNFVWGGLQRNEAEAHTYGIYGIPDWKTNRESPDPGPKGQLHIWRPYDYPHITVMYFGLYRIARYYPHITTQLTQADYLKRAAGTALAMFTVPIATGDWSAYETGFYNETIIPELIDALSEAGMTTEAKVLRGHWERKVAFFINDNPNLFGSEYPFDSTGFESTQALARYAIDHQPSTIAPKAARHFSETQMAANLFCRGVIEPAYYTLGSDYRAEAGDSFTLTYMSQMGGAAVMDYALHDAADPHSYIRLGYASYLSAWALLNSGTPESGYGYWYPGVENDGAAGGGFEPAPSGMTWLDQPHHRGSWYYSCETDLGFCGALRMAATLIADDPVFGRICYGGDWRATSNGVSLTPKDGVRRRLHARLKDLALSLILTNDRFARDQVIELSEDGALIRFHIESDTPAPHTTGLRLSGLKPGSYSLETASGTVTFKTDQGHFDMALSVDGASAFVIKRL